MDLKDLYQEIILDHGKNPRNLKKSDNFNKDAKGHNPLCGDKVHIYLKVDENNKISDIAFEGSGCAISMASASIMTDLMKEKKEVEVKELVDDFLEMIKQNPELKSKILGENEKTKLMSLSGVKKYPMRVKCATMAWHTLTAAMKNVPHLSVGAAIFPGSMGTAVTVLTRQDQTMNQTAGYYPKVQVEGCTPLLPALIWSGDNLVTQKEERKILFVVTDGDPDDMDDCIKTIYDLRQGGIEVYGIGIDVREKMMSDLFGNKHVCIEHVGELAEATFSLLETTLLAA